MKNDTANNETGIRSVVNRPFWIASGTVSAPNVTLYVSPGRMRFPYTTKVVYSGQPNSLTFGGLASRFYTVFMRSNQTFYVSGSTTATIPSPKYADSEYLGQVWTGASLDTASLQGPWNQGANFNPYEQRGEAAAVTAGVPMVYQWRGPSSPANFTVGATQSGVAWLNYSDRGLAPVSMLYAQVQWYPSGSLALGSPGYLTQSGVINITPQFDIYRGGGVASAGTHLDTRMFLQPQNPDATGANKITTTIAVPSNATPTSTGYKLMLQTAEPSTPAMQMRIAQIIFTGVPGYRASGGDDPASEPS